MAEVNEAWEGKEAIALHINKKKTDRNEEPNNLIALLNKT